MLIIISSIALAMEDPSTREDEDLMSVRCVGGCARCLTCRRRVLTRTCTATAAGPAQA